MTESAPASLQQEPLWFLHRLNPSDSAYHVAFALELKGALDRAVLREALQDVVEVQDGLRIAMPSRAGRATLEVASAVPLPFAEASVAQNAEPEVAAEALLQRLADRPFDLASAPLFRVLLIERASDGWTLGCVFHHVIFDGASVELFIEALLDAYVARARGASPELARPASLFSDFVTRQRAWVETSSGEAARAYWREQLVDTSVLELPSARPRRESTETRGATWRHRLDPELRPRLEAFARQSGATPFMVLLTAFEVVISRHAGVRDVSVGTPISLRMDPSVRGRIGLFVNTTVIRADIDGAAGFAELLGRVKTACLGAFKHHKLPFAQVVEAVSPERSTGRNPLFSVMFILQTPPRFSSPEGLEVRHREFAPSASKFDLSASVVLDDEGFELSLEYRTGLFDEGSVARMAERFEVFLTAALAEPDTAVGDLPLGTPSELAALEGHAQGRPFPADASIAPLPEQLARWVVDAPDRVVLDDAGVTLTVAELDRRASRLASGLATRGLGEGDRVGLALDPGADLLAAAFAVWRCGAVYVPLERALPAARVAAMVDDARARLVIRPRGASPLLDPASKVVEVEVSALEADAPAPHARVEGSELAYVIYTSGSTGRPKGVEVRHEGLARSIAAFGADLALPKRATWAALTTFSFDISVIELFGPLVHDGVAVVVPRALSADARSLARWLDEVKPTLLQTTPTRWRMLLSAGWRGHPELVALSGGEVLTADLARELLARSMRVANIYGPTECTVWASFHEVTPAELEGLGSDEGLPVGPAIPGLRLHVLDRRGHRTPFGVAGEVCLAGAQLARGYLGRPELTTKAFTAAPHVGEVQVYATGDRARVRADGEIELLGRADHQVKIRGHRVELGEVEACLRDLDEVDDAAVVFRAVDDGEPLLLGFVSSPAGRVAHESELRAQLSNRLPAHMVPARVGVLVELPRTASGKVDRRRLPTLSAERTKARVRPASDLLELLVLRIWEDVLRRSPVGLHDDFFELGGQSVIAVELAARLEAGVEHRVEVMDVLRSRTPAALVARLRAGGVQLPWRTLVAHRSQGERRPLFTVGASQMMRSLLRHIAPEVPVFSLNVFGLVPDTGPIVRFDVETIASAFVEDMKRAAPSGPYRLLGYCGDTKITLEVARQLQAQGDEVSFFGTIDVIGETAEHRWDFRQVASLVRDYGWAYPRGVLRRRQRHRELVFKRASARVSSLVDRVLLRHSNKQGRHDLFYARYLEALENYRAAPFSGEATFFVCTEYYRRTNEGALRALAGGRARVYEVPGFHESLFDSPYVEGLGEQISRALDV